MPSIWDFNKQKKLPERIMFSSNPYRDELPILPKNSRGEMMRLNQSKTEKFFTEKNGTEKR
jgi:hypothetical protein